MQLLGLRQHFFKSPLNLPDFILVLVSWIDIMIELILGSEKTRVPPVFHVIITLKALRLLRIFIVIKVCSWEYVKLSLMISIKFNFKILMVNNESVKVE